MPLLYYQVPLLVLESTATSSEFLCHLRLPLMASVGIVYLVCYMGLNIHYTLGFTDKSHLFDDV